MDDDRFVPLARRYNATWDLSPEHRVAEQRRIAIAMTRLYLRGTPRDDARAARRWMLETHQTQLDTGDDGHPVLTFPKISVV